MFVCVAQIGRLEQNIQQLQLNLTSAHQRHKAECARYDEQVAALQQELADVRNRGQVLEEEVDRKEDQIKRNEAEIASCRDDIRSKVEEVDIIPVLWSGVLLLKIVCVCVHVCVDVLSSCMCSCVSTRMHMCVHICMGLSMRRCVCMNVPDVILNMIIQVFCSCTSEPTSRYDSISVV